MPLQKKKPADRGNLSKILEQMAKDFGEGAVIALGQSNKMDVESIPTGNIAIDRALGVGGFPKGRISELIGESSSGKTTLCLTVIAQCQKAGGRAAFIDAEHALDKKYAAALGVDLENLLFTQPKSGQEALRIVEALARTGEVDLIVVDSVAALTTQAEIDGEIGDALVGQHARMMSAGCRKLVPQLSDKNCCLIFTNQWRNQIGVMFGDPRTTPGGKALKFYSSIRIDIGGTGKIKDSDDVHVGKKTKLKVIKNKVAAPFEEAEFDIIFGKGIDNLGTLVDEALSAGVLEKRGSWVSFQGNQVGQGREGTKDALSTDENLRNQIEEALTKKEPMP